MIVYLVRTEPNDLFTKVVTKKPKEVRINLRTKKYTVEGLTGYGQNIDKLSQHSIGIACRARRVPGAVCGVFDTNNIDHVNTMLRFTDQNARKYC